ncbi:tRNA lysidine(34) synthetase TilS [Paraliobacillus salinarum]|uniref:tRNA lysidine(34) synthetase TilS n=1 Tax=Paraliobacillus salinarum TaxID=1158996 RepID=UPI0015F73081|nr:tRNA lysidine(34) synthetase TilS [Paraliobacillus salinarum]
MLNQKVDHFIKQHQLFHKSATLIVGVSGGPDSMALLHYLQAKKKVWDWTIIAVAINHCLRGEDASADIEFVRNYCLKHNITFEAGIVDVPKLKREEHLGTQDAARRLRYSFFEEKMKQYDADYLVLGHHGDDQIETMFMRMTRSANPSALKGIPLKRPFATGYIVRPFLAINKEMIKMYCLENGITPRLDPSNEEDVYTRNYFRKHLLPLLKEQNPSLHHSIQRLSESIGADQDYLEEQAKKALKKVLVFPMTQSAVNLSINLVKTYPFALQRRMFHLILNYLYHTIPSGLSYEHEQYFLNLIHSNRANVTIDLPNGLKLHKAYETILFTFNQEDAPFFSTSLPVPGQITLPSGDIVLATVTDDNISTINGKNTLILPVSDSEKYASFVVRYRKPGDRMHVKGLGGSKKVKDIFIDKKIPLQKRDQWPLVIDQEGHVLWIIGLTKGMIPNQKQVNQYIQLEYRGAELY